MERLIARVRFSTHAGPYLAAGDALGAALATAGPGGLPQWANDLADAMVGGLLRVQDETMDHAEAGDRVRLAYAAALLSIVRPRASAACDAAIGVWLGWGIGTPSAMAGTDGLAQRALLAMFVEDLDQASACVDELLVRDPDGVGFLLHDWVVARLQGHGTVRDGQCFDHLRISVVCGGAAGVQPGWIALAFLVHASLSSRNRQEMLPVVISLEPSERASGVVDVAWVGVQSARGN